MFHFKSFGRMIAALVAVAILALPTPAEERPWKGVGVGTAPPAGADGITHVQMRGESSHTGAYTVVGAHTFISEEDFVGSFVLTAANGDELWVLYTGTFDTTDTTNPFSFSGALTVIGGTGRFADATGSADYTAEIDADTFEFRARWRGVLDY
jgi:hypothetical protein